MNKIRLGVVGLGGRGFGWIKGEFVKLDNVEVAAVCDLYQDRVEKTQDFVKEVCGNTPFGTIDYKELVIRDDVDIVMVLSSWESHTEVAVASMKAGKFTAVEVGGAYTVAECWDLVETYEATKTPIMFMENCCYGEYETMLLNMVKKGIFGEIVHCEGGYCHELRSEIANGEKNRHYRLNNYINRNCENYPTHELGPISKLLNINRGNRMLTLQSFCSEAKGLNAYIKENLSDNEKLMNTTFAQADIFKTFIKCENGETIELTLDTTLPRFYSRGLTVRGTKGMYNEDNNMIFLDGEHDEFHFKSKALWDNAKDYQNEFKNDLWADREKLYAAGHGGMDLVLLNAILHCFENKENPTIDVYDMAAWMVITALSENSIKNGGMIVDIPDFTRGKYKNREDHNTGIYSLE